MFDNIGSKIKSYAKANFWIETIASVLLGIILLAIASETYSDLEEIYTIIGIVFLLGGPATAYITSIFLYGFGQLVENSDVLATKKNKGTVSSVSTTDDKINTLKKWKEQGLITEEEYKQKMENL